MDKEDLYWAPILLFHLIITTTQCLKYYYHYLIDEAQNRYLSMVTLLRSDGVKMSTISQKLVCPQSFLNFLRAKIFLMREMSQCTFPGDLG